MATAARTQCSVSGQRLVFFGQFLATLRTQAHTSNSSSAPSGQFELAVDLDRDAARERDVAHRRARVFAELRSPQLEEQIRSAVDDGRRL